MDNVFLTPESFAVIIEKICQEHGINRIDAILMYCDENEIEYEEIVPIVKGSMKERIKADAMEAGFFKQEGTLPI